jgi:hypothetical protein
MDYDFKQAIERGFSQIAHELSGFTTGNPGDNSLMCAFHEVAEAGNNIASAIRELAEVVAKNNPL